MKEKMVSRALANVAAKIARLGVSLGDWDRLIAKIKAEEMIDWQEIIIRVANDKGTFYGTFRGEKGDRIRVGSASDVRIFDVNTTEITLFAYLPGIGDHEEVHITTVLNAGPRMARMLAKIRERTDDISYGISEEFGDRRESGVDDD